jgi:hypothetical protein
VLTFIKQRDPRIFKLKKNMAAPDGSAWPIKFKTGSKLGVFKKRKEVNDAKKDRSVHEKTRKEVCPRT